jgi:hypothetical protein
LGRGREGVKKGNADKGREGGYTPKWRGCWHARSLGEPLFGTRFFIQQNVHPAKAWHFQILLDEASRQA